MKKQHIYPNTSIIVLGLISLAAVAVAGYSYYRGVYNIGGKTSGACSISNTSAGKGCGMMGSTSQKSIKTQTTSVSQDVSPKTETLFMTYTEEGLTPKVVTLQKGKKYTIIINAMTTVYGCMNAITLPGLDDNLQQIVEGSKIVFNIVPTKAGTYDFVCAMGVSHGAQVIVQ